jgi:hemin uptake protein HemP
MMPPGRTGRQGAAVAQRTRVIDSRMLLAGAAEVLIEHGGTIYRLRHTAQGKLILTK